MILTSHHGNVPTKQYQWQHARFIYTQHGTTTTGRDVHILHSAVRMMIVPNIIGLYFSHRISQMWLITEE